MNTQITINDGFVGYSLPERNAFFSGSDSEQNFQSQLKIKPKDWYFATKNISYIRNSLGHRCKNIENIDLKNYFLFLGCSHTEGIGMAIEDTFPYLVAEKCKVDYYNLGLGGAGIDVCKHNLLMWLLKQQELPKAIVWQWPHLVRSSILTENDVVLHGGWTEDKNIGSWLLSSEEVKYFDSVANYIKILLQELRKKTKVIELSITLDMKNALYFHREDYARDKHCGPKTHNTIAETVVNKLS